ncbi:MAG: hypothetical protein ACR2RD_16495 [Woeseiaceae bacterium]
MSPFRTYPALLLALIIWTTGQASPLFDDVTVLEMTIEGPLSTVIDDAVERRQQAFSIGVEGEETEVSVRMRGKSRVVHCRFPPLRLNFAAEDVVDSVFDGQDKLKLVTHCKNSQEYESNVLEEYAAYQILNVLTDLSFRTRLLRIRYVDTDEPQQEPITRFGFVVESDEELAARVGGEAFLVRNVTRSMLDERHAALIFVFHYLIGNTDWSLVRYIDDEHCCHNGKLLSIGETNYYIPYDFDMSGLVNARYARPQPDLRLRSVRVRRYRGYCTDSVTLEEALEAVVSHRNEILAVIADLPGLREKDRSKQIRYIEGFIETADSQAAKLLKEFERRCL